MANGDVLTAEALGMHSCDYEIAPFATELNFHIEAEVWEEGGVAPTSLIADNQNWYVIVRWRLTGPLTYHLCGYWCPQVHVECYGGGTEETFGLPELVEFDPCGDGSYEARIDIPAGAVSAEDCGTMCCVAITLSSFDLCERAGHVYAFCKGPCIMFHHAPHEEVPHPD